MGSEKSTPSFKAARGGIGPSWLILAPKQRSPNLQVFAYCELHSPAPWVSVAFSSSCVKWEEKDNCTGHVEAPDPKLGAQLEESTLHFLSCTEPLGFFARVTVTSPKPVHLMEKEELCQAPHWGTPGVLPGGTLA